MAIARYLLDTSVIARLDTPAVKHAVEPLLERALCATCAILNLEALWSARSADDYGKIRNWRNSILEYVDTDERDLERTQEVQELLAQASMHRAVKLPDLLIAAVAEHNNLTVLHYDSNFDIVSDKTGQPTQWVVPRGSVS